MEHQQNLQFASDLRTVFNRLIKKIRKESPTGQTFSFTERSTMGLLYEHKALLPSELAAMEMITNQSMSQVLNHLFEMGYIIRIPSATDKRKVNISLSEEGEKIFLQFKNERDEWLLNAIEKTCTPEEKELLKKIIVPFTKLVEFK
ncbi:MarR family winged helix-turn-helix transcriptional regulator [Mucilaginibacter gotjawali]|uniref:DNA-binding MarR family transcriptional regulator n=1 Tax=Mucilaginibacter gotjawali TaxID=1550579 RepID=A0A839S9V1_9SPHI|nr:MarR family transcriptional regulator [Mucilaginibacter gotjawali]MBB3054606.1 DNA-binding MarR family transcriptional regulator [Mucilaginibacter gotjawali]